MKKLLLSVFIFFASLNNHPLYAASRKQNCRDVLIVFIYKAQQTLVDPNQNYKKTISLLKTKFGKDFYEKSELKKFEDDVQKVFQSKRNHDKNWKLLEGKWDLNPQQSFYLKAFYSFFIYKPSLLPLKTRNKVFADLKKISLQHQLNSDPQLQARYAYYEQSIGKKSVPEISKELGIPQSEVYRELSYFELSIIKAFENDFRNGEDQSSRFVRHQREIQSRSVSWNRKLNNISEEILLVDMLEKGMTHSQIATALNKLAGTPNPEDPHIRTERSVSYKVQSLGLSQPQKKYPQKLVLKDYGLVKENGFLIPPTTVEFLIAHKEKGKTWCAQKLKVSLSGLRGFIKRHHLEVFFEKNPESKNNLAEDITPFVPIEDQNVLNWIRLKKRVPFSTKEWSEALNVQVKDRVMYWILENKAFPQSSEEWMQALTFSKPE